MTELDQALEQYIRDDNQQAPYYDLVLNTDFYIPITDDEVTPLEGKEGFTPLVIEADDKPYLMLFDREERLTGWAKKPINYVILAGYGVARISTPGLHWVVNAGEEFAKEFVPEEISWLRDSVINSEEEQK